MSLGRLLLVTLEATRLNADLPVLGALRSWLNSSRGIGDIERGMARQGYDLQLTRYDENRIHIVSDASIGGCRSKGLAILVKGST